jgi:hypothetical protein
MTSDLRMPRRLRRSESSPTSTDPEEFIMRSKYAYAALAAAAFALTGCGGGSGGYSGDAGNSAAASPSPPVSTVTPFTPFVRDQFTHTSDATEPASVNDQEWMFDEDEMAYDDVLQ